MESTSIIVRIISNPTILEKKINKKGRHDAESLQFFGISSNPESLGQIN